MATTNGTVAPIEAVGAIAVLLVVIRGDVRKVIPTTVGTITVEVAVSIGA